MFSDRLAHNGVWIDENDAPVAGEARLFELAWHLRCDFDARKAGAHDDHRGNAFRKRLLAQSGEVRVEPNGRRVSIHVKAVGRQPGYCRAHQLAAERQHQPIVSHDLAATIRCDAHMLLDGIYSLDLGNPVIDPYRVKQFDKRYGRIANVDLIVAYPYVVVGVAVDDDYFDIRCRRTDFVALASSTKGGPEPSESRTKDNNARHMIFPNARLELISRENRNQAC